MKSIPVERVCAATGLGKRQVYRLTREGRIPAQIVGRRFVMTEAQFQQLQHNGITPPKAPTSAATSFIRRVA